MSFKVVNSKIEGMNMNIKVEKDNLNKISETIENIFNKAKLERSQKSVQNTRKNSLTNNNSNRHYQFEIDKIQSKTQHTTDLDKRSLTAESSNSSYHHQSDKHKINYSSFNKENSVKRTESLAAGGAEDLKASKLGTLQRSVNQSLTRYSISTKNMSRGKKTSLKNDFGNFLFTSKLLTPQTAEQHPNKTMNSPMSGKKGKGGGGGSTFNIHKQRRNQFQGYFGKKVKNKPGSGGGREGGKHVSSTKAAKLLASSKNSKVLSSSGQNFHKGELKRISSLRSTAGMGLAKGKKFHGVGMIKSGGASSKKTHYHHHQKYESSAGGHKEDSLAKTGYITSMKHHNYAKYKSRESKTKSVNKLRKQLINAGNSISKPDFFKQSRLRQRAKDFDSKSITSSSSLSVISKLTTKSKTMSRKGFNFTPGSKKMGGGLKVKRLNNTASRGMMSSFMDNMKKSSKKTSPGNSGAKYKSHVHVLDKISAKIKKDTRSLDKGKRRQTTGDIGAENYVDQERESVMATKQNKSPFNILYANQKEENARLKKEVGDLKHQLEAMKQKFCVS